MNELLVMCNESLIVNENNNVNYTIEENRKAIERFLSMESNKLPEEMMDVSLMYIETFRCEK